MTGAGAGSVTCILSGRATAFVKGEGAKERQSEGRKITQTTTAMCHGIRYTCIDTAFGTMVNVMQCHVYC